MMPLVHFVVGISVALVVLTFVDRPVREEFLLVFASGVWALIPDTHWLFREYGSVRIATGWKAFHQSPFANLFWLHRLLDDLETAHPHLEILASLVVLFGSLLIFYRFNDWSQPT